MEFIISIVFGILLIIAINIPYIIFIGIFVLLILAITTKKVASKTLKAVLIMVILLYATIIIGSFESGIPSARYTEIKEINENQSIIGKSKEEVIEVLGKPKREYSIKDGNEYEYNAGKISKKSYWGLFASAEYYDFYVYFDENGKVERTSMKLIP